MPDITYLENVENVAALHFSRAKAIILRSKKMGLFSKKKDESREDYYNGIISMKIAIKEYQKKKLSKLYLYPLEFGGVEDPLNIIYVPDFVVDAKDNIDRHVAELLEKGLVNNYNCSTEYKGKSFVPSKLIIEATGEREFSSSIDIW